MEQKIVTISRRIDQLDKYGMNLDSVTEKLNSEGWKIKQIVSTSFQHQVSGSNLSFPVLVITLLVEKE